MNYIDTTQTVIMRVHVKSHTDDTYFLAESSRSGHFGRCHNTSTFRYDGWNEGGDDGGGVSVDKGRRTSFPDELPGRRRERCIPSRSCLYNFKVFI